MHVSNPVFLRSVSPSSRKHKLKQYSRYADLRNQLNSGIHFNPNKSYSTENFKEPTNHQRSSRIEENQEGIILFIFYFNYIFKIINI